MIWPITPIGAMRDLLNNRRATCVKRPASELPEFKFGVKIGLMFMCLFLAGSPALATASTRWINDDDLTAEDWEKVIALEQQRITAIQSVVGSVIAIYGESRQGGGAGVIIHPSGIALTNHHVIMGAGVSGWGGLADGNYYRWKLIGTDPGGDVSVIQMEGLDSFPYANLGDSDTVRPGDWALAMGNPFVLTEDQYPTVTLGIVSGVKRYQPGEGGTMLVYGNCIQIDSSINPGNSGGPLFNLQGQVIGINGRGSFSFKDRGKVNVGLGYAISANQIKNFIPDLLATKLIQHGTLDASFSDRQGKVVCSTINRDSPVAAAGLSLGDQLLEFEGEPIASANQFTNLICTLPVDWPATLKIRKPDNEELTIHVRLLGLPYPKPPPDRRRPGQPDQPESEEERQEAAMRELLSAAPNQIRYPDVNQYYAQLILDHWKSSHVEMQNQLIQEGSKESSDLKVLELIDQIILLDQGKETLIGHQSLKLASDGRFRMDWVTEAQDRTYLFDGKSFFVATRGNQWKQLTTVEAKLNRRILQAYALATIWQEQPFQTFGACLIDGGDKAQGQPAFRLSVTDSDREPMYVWISVEDGTGQPFTHRLLKAGAHKDSSGMGSVLFSDWQSVSVEEGEAKIDWKIPQTRTFVKGLDEEVHLILRNRERKWLKEIDDSIFDTPANIEDPNADKAKTDSPKTDSPKTDSPKTDSPKVEPNRNVKSSEEQNANQQDSDSDAHDSTDDHNWDRQTSGGLGGELEGAQTHSEKSKNTEAKMGLD